ncbi:hypothetical protein HY633_04825 [Candidatus Uhrbacteria bacterium]|nr:hypothetical protein [Candidatus Uhrbacteria bacterium]
MHRAGNHFAVIGCPACHGNGTRQNCKRCCSTGTITVRCARCSCQTLIGSVELMNGESLLFRVEPTEIPSPSICSCQELPTIPSARSGHMSELNRRPAHAPAN